MTLQRTNELYQLRVIPAAAADPNLEHWHVDGVTTNLVLRATGHKDARRRAAFEAATRGDGQSAAWLDPEQTTCTRLQDDGEPGVICVEVLW